MCVVPDSWRLAAYCGCVFCLCCFVYYCTYYFLMCLLFNILRMCTLARLLAAGNPRTPLRSTSPRWRGLLVIASRHPPQEEGVAAYQRRCVRIPSL